MYFLVFENQTITATSILGGWHLELGSGLSPSSTLVNPLNSDNIEELLHILRCDIDLLFF